MSGVDYVMVGGMIEEREPGGMPVTARQHTASEAALAEAPGLTRCPVPGCDRTFIAPNALGPHLAAHRKHGDVGVPPINDTRERQRDRERKAAKRELAKAKATKPKAAKPAIAAPSPVTGTDIVQAFLDLFYPDSIPRRDAYDVARWITLTEQLADRERG